MHDYAIYYLDGITPVVLERSYRARRLTLSVSPKKGVRVAVPRGIPIHKAEEFVLRKRSWVYRQVGRLEKIATECSALVECSGEPNADRDGAGQKLVGRLDELAAEHGFVYNRVSLRAQRTRWGSCSEKNNISLNIKLAQLPAHLVDYVLLHELVHTRVKNHGKEFWDELGAHVEGAKQKSRELRRFGLVIL
ncbi:MAG: M48 family metallopeptidase [Chloroflexi bacterium]|nr:M48 family metallopeptidase [Chloroflexota bacterium]